MSIIFFFFQKEKVMVCIGFKWKYAPQITILINSEKKKIFSSFSQLFINIILITNIQILWSHSFTLNNSSL